MPGACFVVMGFGKKTDFETGRTLDLDKTYRNIIKPAVIAADLECTRADEIPHSGVIDVPMYQRLLTADVVVADLSTSNKNAFYELGVRHALRPYTTIVICEDGTKSFPFDLNHVLVRPYHHMGEGIDSEEVDRFRAALTQAIKDILNQDPRSSDSPVYTFLNGLTPPALNAAMKAAAVEMAGTDPVGGATPPGGMIYSAIMQQVDAAQGKGDFISAKVLLSLLRQTMKDAAGKAAAEASEKRQADVPERPEDPYVVQRLALVTYKSKLPSPLAALEEARAMLDTLNPETSNDTETLGLWGSVHKRLWELTGAPEHLDQAVRGYERGFYLRNDYYNGINFAFLLNLRASSALKRAETAASPAEALRLRAEAVASFVDAGRVRAEVLQICDTVLQTEKLSSDDDKYWVLATMAEAYLGVGDEPRAARTMQEAVAVSSANWMKESTDEQMNKLRLMLADSPLRFMRAE